MGVKSRLDRLRRRLPEARDRSRVVDRLRRSLRRIYGDPGDPADDGGPPDLEAAIAKALEKVYGPAGRGPRRP